MSESFIMDFIPYRLKQLQFVKWHVRHRDITVGSGKTIIIPAYNELFFIVDDPEGLIVESDYGVYDTTGYPSEESIHAHRGEIAITNPTAQKVKIKFIQVIIVN